ncbi:MAG TPA: LamG domain-containing protein [Chitinophagaceae bacterium]|nr:LamG domain-containing protein [Chitinophagaceae bacterium]
MKMKNKNIIVAASALFAVSTIITSCTNKDGINGYAPPLTLGGYTSAKEIAPANLVAYWAFDNSLIDSVSGQSGTNTGTSFTAGVKKSAIQGGDNKYVLFNPGTTIQNLQSFTVTAWVNSPQNTDGIVGLVDLANTGAFWGNLTIFFENGGTATNGVLKVHVNNNGTDAWLGNYTVTNAWNRWIQVSVSYDAGTSTFKVYINGSKLATQTVAGYGPLHFQNATKMVFGTVQFQTTPSLNGGTMQPWASFLKGQLDEVRIYNVALSESDVNFLNKLEARGK